MAFWQAFFYTLPGLFFVAFYGAATGSFLNVVVYRLPRGISTIAPRSRCPRCALAIRPWHNLPVLGWLLLRGRCRDCRGAIAARYPLVEAFSAALFVFSFLHHQEFAKAVLSCAVIAWAFSLALIDFDLRALPDSLTLPMIGIGLLVRLFFAGIAPFCDALIASAGGFFGLSLLARLWRMTRGEDGLGAGDVRFSAALGALFGSLGLLEILFGAAVLALLLALLPRQSGPRGKSLPFGTALGMATIAYLLGWIPPGAWS